MIRFKAVRKTVGIPIAFVFIVVLSLTPTVYALYPATASWPMYRHDAAHSGATASDVPSTNSTLWTWGTTTHGGAGVLSITTTPLIADGVVIFQVIAMQNGRAYAVDERTGLQLWQYVKLGWLTAPSYVDGRVFFGLSNYAGGVVCLNVSTGVEIWKQDTTPYYVLGSPLVNKGIVYVGLTDNSTSAFDTVTGNVRWVYKTNGPVSSSPAADGDLLFFGSDDKKLYALNVSGPTPVSLWNFTANGAIQSTPTIDGGRVFFGSDNHMLYALNETTGKLIWSWATTDGTIKIRNGVALANNIVYVASAGLKKIYALHADAAPGNYTEVDISTIRYWTRDFSSDYGVYGFNEPVYANGKIIVTSTGGSPAVIYSLDASNGNTLWKRIVNWWPAIGTPIVADDHIWYNAYWWDPGSFTLYCLGQPFLPTTYNFKVNAGGTSFDVTLVTNSTVTKLNTTVLESQRKISFDVAGIGTTGMSNITLPNNMLGGPYALTVNGKPPWSNATTIINATHTALYLTYNASSKYVVQITGTTAVPEFSAPVAILVWGILALTIITMRKRLSLFRPTSPIS